MPTHNPKNVFPLFLSVNICIDPFRHAVDDALYKILARTVQNPGCFSFIQRPSGKFHLVELALHKTPDVLDWV